MRPDSADAPAAPARFGRLLPLLGLLVCAAVTAWLIGENVELALEARFSLDEYQYSHAGWRIARGEVIYRDFFEHHQPLLHQLLGLAWRLLDDDPANLLALRLLMLPLWLLAVAAGVWINRRSCGRWALITAPAILMVPTLAAMVTQVRPDPLSAALFLAALAVLYPSRLPPRVRGFLAGALTVAALWGTLKVLYYGLVLVAALGADLRRGRRGGDRLLGSPAAFVAGAAAAAVPIALYLTVSGSWHDWYRWSIGFSFAHQWHYPGFPWQSNLNQLIQHSFWLLPFAAVGVVATVRRLRREGADGDPDLLLLGALVTTLASVVWQSAAYLYSLVPLTLVLAVLAARGVALCARTLGARPGSAGRFGVALLALLALGELRRTDFAFAKMRQDDNRAQLARLERLDAMTDAETPVFHVWGGQISRPAVHYFYFLEAVTMQLEDARLRRELVPAMIDAGATVYLHHDLFPRLVPALRAYLLEHFQPLDPMLWVYGRQVPTTADDEGDSEGARRAEGRFRAVRDGRYFVHPPDALGRGQTLWIDGRALASPIVALEAGEHSVRYRGRAETFFLMWLPRDGLPFVPRPELKPAR